MSIYGRICYRFVYDFCGDIKLKNIGYMKELGQVMFLSKEMLLPVIDTEAEKDLFDFIINALNTAPVTFIIKSQGEYFDNEIRQKVSNTRQMQKYILETVKWNRIAEKLGINPIFVDLCYDKDAMWMMEFLTKFYKYTVTTP